MRPRIRKLKSSYKAIRAAIWDLLFSPLTLLAVIWFRRVRYFGWERMPIAKAISDRFGIYPLRDHFYEPLINRTTLDREYRVHRTLPGISWNSEYQVEIIQQFDYHDELAKFPRTRPSGRSFYFENTSFSAGDAGFLYSMIRFYKPRRIIEIGSGYSTMLMLSAIEKNRQSDKGSDRGRDVELTCIEPYRHNWMEGKPLALIKEPVEHLAPEFFLQLQARDILFIDSSHMIRPQGDVLFEYLQILPILNPGVFVHIHDIYSPQDYPNRWLIDGDCFWNEQYLLEAYLTSNRDYRIVGALNYLSQDHKELLESKFPYFDEVGSFWIQKVNLPDTGQA